jgi:hypothetical protein
VGLGSTINRDWIFRETKTKEKRGDMYNMFLVWFHSPSGGKLCIQEPVRKGF